MAIPLIAMGASAALKGAAALKQKQEANRLAQKAGSRPALGVPSALQEKANLAKNMADSSLLPSQGYFENQIGANASRANREIQNTGGSANDIIAGLTQVDANTRSQTNALASAGAQNQQQNKDAYGGTLSEVAGQQNEMFDYNINQPYQSEQLKAQSLKDASNRNLNNAVDSGIDMTQIYGNGRQMDDAMGTNYYGGNKPVGANKPRSSNRMFRNVPDTAPGSMW